MRLQAERQQSESTYERGVRHSPRLMEAIVGSPVEPRLRLDDTHNRPAEEPRLDHERPDEPGLPIDRSHHRARHVHHPRTLERLARDPRARLVARENVSVRGTCARDRACILSVPLCAPEETFSRLAPPIASDSDRELIARVLRGR